MAGIERGIELTSVADLPSNSGLGSSSSFTVALLNALYTYKRNFVSSARLAEGLKDKPVDAAIVGVIDTVDFVND